MNKKLHYLLIGVLSLVMLGKANPAYSFADATFYYKIAYCVNESGAGTVYAKGPKYANNSNTEAEYARTSNTSYTNANMSKAL